MFRLTGLSLLLAGFFFVPAAVAQNYQILGVKSPEQALPAGFDYWHIEAWVPAGGDHGAPYVIASPNGTTGQRGILLSTEVGTSLSWGQYIPGITLRQAQTGSDANPAISVGTLQRKADGAPILVTTTSSSIGGPNSLEAATLELNSETTALVPSGYGVPLGGSSSQFFGGTETDYAGIVGLYPAIWTANGFQRLDTGINPVAGFAFDRENGVVVGEVNGSARYWTEQASDNWTQNTPEIPGDLTEEGRISFIAGDLMGGHLLDANLGEIVPVLWKTDGTVSRVFNLPGYTVTEMILDEGVVTVLLNTGFFDSPSYLFAEGWSAPRLVFGEILPPLPSGAAGIARDISSGGSLWMLTKVSDGQGETYSTLSLETGFFSPGDFDIDGDVDGTDFLVWQRGVGAAYDGDDLVDWRDHFGEEPVTAAVPEPYSASLMMAAMAVFAAAQGRRKNRTCV